MLKLLSVFIGVFCFSFSKSFAQIEHVEPLNWWVGMKNPNLQVMVHGVDVGSTIPSIKYPGVTLKKTSKGDSKNYLFLDFEIAKTAKPGNLIINFKRGGKQVYSHNYPLLKRTQDGSKIKGFSSADAIYLVVPDRFANGDYTNDVVAGTKENKINRAFEGGRHGGDLRGIINNLDYIKEMGFTAIWPTPVLENNMPEYSYHGYAITNHYKVDPRYGTLDEYKELSKKASEKGLKLIFDEVLNHTGSFYWWMSDLPFKNWLNYPDATVMTSHRRTTNQDRYASAFDKDLMTNGWFVSSMPDMNGKNPFMANYLIQCSIWWIETLQLGGIRQDTYGYSDKGLLTNWSCRIMDEYPNFNMVGEEWSTNPLTDSYWQQGMKNQDGYKSCLKSIMDFPMQTALVQALKDDEVKDFSKGLPKLYESLSNDFIYPNPKNILVFGDNHDMNRLFTQLNKDIDLTKMAVAYLLTTRGIPQMLYGTEVLLDNTGKLENHGIIRSDFPGGWKEDSINGFSGMGLATEVYGFQDYVRKLLNWRKANPVISNGKLTHFVPFEGLYVYFRYDEKKTVMVVLNKNKSVVNVDLKRFAEILAGKTLAKNILTNEEFPLNNSISVSPTSALIVEVR